MDLEELIPMNHLVRVVNAAVNHLDDAIFAAAYPGGGRDSYHPKMLTKIIVYSYTQKIYSSRSMAKAIRELADEKQYRKEDLPELGESSTITAEKLEKAVQQLENKLLVKPKDRRKQ